MNKNLEKIAEVVQKNLGREELIDWWRVTLNAELSGFRICLSNKQLAQHFRSLRKNFVVMRRQVYFSSGQRWTYYKIIKKVGI